MAKVALLLDLTFDDEAFQVLFDRLRGAGHETLLVGPHQGRQVDGRGGHTHLTLDASVDDVDAKDVDAAIVPAGFKRDHLRTHERLLNFLRDVYADGKPVGVLHEPGWVLVGAEAKARGFVTWPAVKRDLLLDVAGKEGAGLERDAVVRSVDGTVASFCEAFLAQLGRGHAEEQGELLAGAEPAHAAD